MTQAEDSLDRHLENQDAEARKRARREWASEAASGLRQRSREEGRCALASGSSLGFCCICMEEGSVEELLTVLPCGHEFHAGCIEQWLVFRGKALVMLGELDAGCALFDRCVERFPHAGFAWMSSLSLLAHAMSCFSPSAFTKLIGMFMVSAWSWNFMVAICLGKIAVR